MPDITLPNTFVAGNTVTAADVEENLYEPRSTPRTFEVINGRLDSDNLDAAVAIGRDMVRRRQFVVGSTRGQTANVDFFKDFYRGEWTLADGTAGGSPALSPDAEIRAKAFVGNTFYLPWDARFVYLTWHLSIVTDNEYYRDGNNDLYSGDDPSTPTGPITGYPDNTVLILFIDGYPVTQLSRRVIDGSFSMLNPVVLSAGALKAMPQAGLTYSAGVLRRYWNDSMQPDARYWSGHCVIDRTNSTDYIPAGTSQFWTKGWHTADIRVAHKVAHARIRTCRVTALGWR